MIPYTEQELTKLELLNYPNPEGLHPNEAEWRDLARKLKGNLNVLSVKYEETKEKLDKLQEEHNWCGFEERMGR